MAVPRILIVDDEPDLLDLIEITLTRMGLEVDRASGVRTALDRLAATRYELCLTDMRLPDGEGMEIVAQIGQRWPHTPVAVITAFGSAENAVAALKAGAFDYLSKPVSIDQLRALVRSALRLAGPEHHGVELPSLIGVSEPMRRVRATIEKLARSQAPVFICGDSGTGKEVAARMIHALGPRANKPFIAVNCGAIPESLMESEFFGHRKGAFTGAERDHDGFFQAAHGGTLFLDEVVELPMAMQVKLLRAIQERRARRVGGVTEEPVDVRILSASQHELRAAVEAGRFRHDLYYRLNVIELRMPRLSERREDIPQLIEHITKRLAAASGRAPPTLRAEAIAALCDYGFPGNVRELENILERAFALGNGDVIGVAELNLPPESNVPESPPGAGEGWPGHPLQDYLDRVEREAILRALDETGWNRTAAARLLGVTLRSLRYRIGRLGIKSDEGQVSRAPPRQAASPNDHAAPSRPITE